MGSSSDESRPRRERRKHRSKDKRDSERRSEKRREKEDEKRHRLDRSDSESPRKANTLRFSFRLFVI